MHFEADNAIKYPARLVVDTLIHRMHDLVAHLPNVESIDTISVTPQDDGSVKTLRHWQGTAKSVPPLLRPFTSRASLFWVDHAVWYPEELRCTWHIDSSNSHLSSCSGTNAFRATGDGSCSMLIEGDFVVFGDKLPGMPTFLGKKVAPTIERIVLSFMRPNFVSTATGVEHLLDADRAGQ